MRNSPVRTASTTSLATSSGSTPPAVVSDNAFSTKAAASSSGGAPDAGWLRRDRAMAVATAPGHRTDTPIGAPTAARSLARHSLAATAANFEIVYGPE